MKVYFACSITGGRQDESRNQAIVASLLEQGHQVPTAGLVRSEIIQEEKLIDPVQVYERDTKWIRECDVLIAEVSTPSHGVGYEIGYALHQSIPVICLYLKGALVSKMITGNQDPNLHLFCYEQIEEALSYLQERFDEINQA